MKKTKPDLWQAVRIAVLKRMEAEGVSESELANQITGADYFGVHRWLAPDSTEPRASIALQLAEWAAKAGTPIAKNKRSKPNKT